MKNSKVIPKFLEDHGKQLMEWQQNTVLGEEKLFYNI